MQDRYAGDIGDFGKFHLLRSLFNQTQYHLKQIWYMYPNETHNNDGLYIDYFEKVKGFDPLLEESFQKLLQGHRSVQALEDLNLFPCEFFSTYVNDHSKERLDYRKSWLQQALNFSENADFIFVDPDNGLATKLDKSTKSIQLLSFEDFKKRSKAGKYIFMDEVQAFYQQSHCVVVYHHLNRTMSHNEQIHKIQGTLQEQFYKVIAIKHKPYSPRVYFFIIKEKKIATFLEEQLSSFQKQFSVHWELFQ